MRKVLHCLPYIWHFPWTRKEHGDVTVFNLLEWHNANKAYEKFERTLLEVVEKVKPKTIFCEGSIRESAFHTLDEGKLTVKNDIKEVKKFEKAWQKYFPQKATSLYPECYVLPKVVLEEIEDQMEEKTEIIFLDANPECRKILSSYYKDLSEFMKLLDSKGIFLENYETFEEYYKSFIFQRIKDIGIKREEKWAEVIEENFQEPSLLICCPAHVGLYSKMPEVIPDNKKVRSNIGKLPKFLSSYKIKHYKTPFKVKVDISREGIEEVKDYLKNFGAETCYLASVLKGFYDGAMGEVTGDPYYSLFFPTYIHTVPIFLGYALLHENNENKGIKQRLKNFGKASKDYAVSYGLGIIGGYAYKALFG